VERGRTRAGTPPRSLVHRTTGVERGRTRAGTPPRSRPAAARCALRSLRSLQCLRRRGRFESTAPFRVHPDDPASRPSVVVGLTAGASLRVRTATPGPLPRRPWVSRPGGAQRRADHPTAMTGVQPTDDVVDSAERRGASAPRRRPSDRPAGWEFGRGRALREPGRRKHRRPSGARPRRTARPGSGEHGSVRGPAVRASPSDARRTGRERGNAREPPVRASGRNGARRGCAFAVGAHEPGPGSGSVVKTARGSATAAARVYPLPTF
jgi:hypothetical protein